MGGVMALGTVRMPLTRAVMGGLIGIRDVKKCHLQFDGIRDGNKCHLHGHTWVGWWH